MKISAPAHPRPRDQPSSRVTTQLAAERACSVCSATEAMAAGGRYSRTCVPERRALKSATDSFSRPGQRCVRPSERWQPLAHWGGTPLGCAHGGGRDDPRARTRAEYGGRGRRPAATPSRISAVRLRGVPHLQGITTFPELNVQHIHDHRRAAGDLVHESRRRQRARGSSVPGAPTGSRTSFTRSTSAPTCCERTSTTRPGRSALPRRPSSSTRWPSPRVSSWTSRPRCSTSPAAKTC
jgi:hypothetical protein